MASDSEKSGLARRRRNYRVAVLAAEWDLEDSVVRAALRRGEIKGFKVGKTWIIPADEKARVERGEPLPPCQSESTSTDLKIPVMQPPE